MKRSRVIPACLFGLGVVMMVCAIAVPALASAVPAVPEIDGTTLSAGLAAASAGVLILRARRRSK